MLVEQVEKVVPPQRVVAAGEHIGSRLQQQLGGRGVGAVAGRGVLGVDNDEVRARLAPQSGQKGGRLARAVGADHVAECQQLHRASPGLP